jgi:hypothetical protein
MIWGDFLLVGDEFVDGILNQMAGEDWISPGNCRSKE